MTDLFTQNTVADPLTSADDTDDTDDTEETEETEETGSDMTPALRMSEKKPREAPRSHALIAGSKK